MCIGYPDSMLSEIPDIIDYAHDFGADTAYIFHDLDDAEPHFHFIFMWRSGVLRWEDSKCKKCENQTICKDCKAFNFVRFMQIHGLKAPKKGTNIIYDYQTSVIKDIDSALDYMVHEHEAQV